jgi:RNA polymerase sigma-70 factor, ECF subfamily
MIKHTAEEVREKVDAVYRLESRHIFATLIRLLGDFELAEDALHDAFGAALEQWPMEGIPANPRAWLVSTGRFKAIDAIRRRACAPKRRFVLELGNCTLLNLPKDEYPTYPPG